MAVVRAHRTTRDSQSGAVELTIEIDSDRDFESSTEVLVSVLRTAVVIADEVLSLWGRASGVALDASRPTSRSYVTTLSFDDTTIMIRIEIRLNSDVSEQTPLLIAVGRILPKILEAVAVCLVESDPTPASQRA